VADVTNPRTVEGPVGLVGTGYIGHLFAQHFALGGYEVRAWSPGRSAGTLHERLRQSLTALAEIGAVERTTVDDVLARISTHDELAQALAPCAAVMESIVEDADVKASCYRDIEAAVGPDVLLWSSTSNFLMTRLADGMDHPERAIVVHPVQTQLIIFVEVVGGEQTSDKTVASTMGFCRDVGLRAIRLRKERLAWGHRGSLGGGLDFTRPGRRTCVRVRRSCDLARRSGRLLRVG
jgi:3-hydroxyacyl-CoA dehydrogenase